MVTSEILIGTESLWTGKAFGKEIKLGLNTRSHAEAIRLRDVRVGPGRQFEADALANAGRKNVGKIIDLSPESADEWRQMREEAKDGEERDRIDFVLSDKLEQADEAGPGRQAKDRCSEGEAGTDAGKRHRRRRRCPRGVAIGVLNADMLTPEKVCLSAENGFPPLPAPKLVVEYAQNVDTVVCEAMADAIRKAFGGAS